MTTREQAWVYQQEQPDDILIVGKMKREPNGIQHLLYPVILPNHKENEAFYNMTEDEKDALNENYLSQNNL